MVSRAPERDRPLGAQRCGPMIRGMLGEEVETCREYGWSILKGPSPLISPAAAPPKIPVSGRLQPESGRRFLPFAWPVGS